VVLIRCPAGSQQRVRIAALSTTSYSTIGRQGKFRLALRKGAVKLRREQIRLAGTFSVAACRARGTLRVRG
jgi:hypothetical protein